MAKAKKAKTMEELEASSFERKTIKTGEDVMNTGWQPVKSSTIDFLKWEHGNILSVRFNSGSDYQYSNVPREMFDKLCNADSVGSMFHVEIKTKPEEYPFVKI